MPEEKKDMNQSKVSFYLDSELNFSLDELVLKLKRKGIKTSKSELIREEIKLILNKYKKYLDDWEPPMRGFFNALSTFCYNNFLQIFIDLFVIIL